MHVLICWHWAPADPDWTGLSHTSEGNQITTTLMPRPPNCCVLRAKVKLWRRQVTVMPGDCGSEAHNSPQGSTALLPPARCLLHTWMTMFCRVLQSSRPSKGFMKNESQCDGHCFQQSRRDCCQVTLTLGSFTFIHITKNYFIFRHLTEQYSISKPGAWHRKRFRIYTEGTVHPK